MDKGFNPIQQFKDIKHAIELLNEWKTKLGLFDWIIKIKICEPHEMLLEDVDGECEYTAITKSAIVRIIKPNYYGNRIIKYCAEEILVHELLHCKFSLFDDEDKLEKLLHQTINDIAKSFICAKYNITNEWFSNITYD